MAVWLAVSLIITLASPGIESAWGQDAADPVVTEYDVDPSWPKRPENVSGQGWVSGLAVDAQDRVWFFRKGPDPVQVYTADGDFVRTWGKGQFVNPHHLRIDHEGLIWVADFGLHIVQKFTPEGKLLLTLGVRGEKGTDETHFNMPTDIAITKSGDIFVTDGYGGRGSQRVVHFTRAGKFVKAFGTAGPGPGQFVLPHAIVVDAKGVLYIADRNSGRIQLFNQDGKFLEQWSNVLMPWGLSVTRDDQLWVCGSSPHWWFRHGKYPEYKDQMLMRFTTDGRVRQTWMLPLGDIGTNKNLPDTSKLKPGETVGAHCIAQDSMGNVYVGDIYGERAQKFRPVSQRTGADEPRPRRLIYNSDADNMFIYTVPPMKPTDVRRYVDEVADAGVTTLFMCPNYGMVMNYPSTVTEMFGSNLTPPEAEQIAKVAPVQAGSLERATANLQALVAAGHDPLGLVIERAKERKLEVFVTFRLNEVHCVDTPDKFPEKMLLARFWHEHPEWRVGKMGDPVSPLHREILGPRTSPIVGTWLWGGLNFAVPEVRQRRLAELRECCERYPIDGLDLDFQRFPIYFPVGKESEHIGTMTEWMRAVRQMTREVGRKRGRPLLVSARIMARPAQNLGLGLDPVTWTKEGLIDFATISHYLRNDFPLPIAYHRRLFPAGLPLYASIEVEPKPDTYRQLARELWQDGADGILLFNFFTPRENGKELPFELLHELGDPKKIRAVEGPAK